MTLAENFHIALASSAADLPGPELLPERLARACAQALPVDGIGVPRDEEVHPVFAG